MTDVINSNSFTMEDQERFARMSGDRNPMHMDRLAARRTQAGEPAVHGVHVLLWAMENLARAGVDLGRLRGGKAKFTSFVRVGRPVSLHVVKWEETGIRITVGCGGTTAMIVRLDFLGGWFAEPRDQRQLQVFQSNRMTRTSRLSRERWDACAPMLRPGNSLS